MINIVQYDLGDIIEQFDEYDGNLAKEMNQYNLTYPITISAPNTGINLTNCPIKVIHRQHSTITYW